MMKKKRLLAVMSLSAIMAISAGTFSSCDSDLIGGDILGNIGNVVEGVVGGVTDFVGGIINPNQETTTVTLSETALELATGESSRLVATVSTGEKATWTTSDDSVVTVSDGRIKAVGAGTATITASVGDVKATCTVTVVKVEITLDKATATVERGQTLTLNAKCSKEGTLKWTSSDDSVLTVKDGVVTAKEEGTATVTVVYGNSNSKAQCEITVVWTSKPSDYEALINGEETKECLNNVGKFVEWHDQNWCGSSVTVTQAEYMNGGVHISYSGVTESCWFGMQLFYKNESNKAGNNYEVSFDIESAVEGDITVNGTVVHLKKGNNSVKVYYTEGSGASLSIQMGVNGGDVIAENQIVLKNLTFADYTPEKLAAPTEFSIGASRVVTVKDNNGDKVSAYQLIFKKDGKIANKVSLQSGESFDDSTMEDGEYQVSIVAVGEGKYQNSDPCETVLTYTVANGGVKYAMENQVASVAVANPGRYYYWTEFAGIESSEYNNGKITFEVSAGGNWYSNQIFYKNPGLTKGAQYTVTLTIQSSVAEKITLNGTVLELIVGTKEYTVNYTEPATDPSFSMQLGVQDVGALASGSFVLSNIVWTEGAGTVTPPDGGETTDAILAGGETDAIANPDKCYYWTEFAGINGGTYKDGKISFEVINGGNWYSNQIFLKKSDLTAGKAYKLTLKISSTVAGKITLNEKEIDLKVGENNVEITYTEDPEKASVSFQAGVNGGVSLDKASFVLSDIVWTAVDNAGGNEGEGGDSGETTPPANENTIANGDEAAAVATPGIWVEWHDHLDWCGTNVTVSKAKLENGEIELTYSGAKADCWFGQQVFYKNASNVAGKTYTLTLTINSLEEGDITVNGTVVHLKKGDNAVTVEYTEVANKASLSIQMGVENPASVIAANTVVIKNVTFTEVTAGGDTNEGEGNEGETTPPVSGVANVTLEFVESYNGTHMHFNATSEFDIATALYVKVNGTQQWQELTATGSGWTFKVFVGDLTLSTYTFEWYDGTGAVVAKAIYTVSNGNDGGDENEGETSTDGTNVRLAWVESYGDHYMHFNAFSEFDIATAAHVKVNGTQQWSETTETGTGWAFKVYVGDLTQETYTFEWYDGTGAVVARAIYTHGNQA